MFNGTVSAKFGSLSSHKVLDVHHNNFISTIDVIWKPKNNSLTILLRIVNDLVVIVKYVSLWIFIYWLKW